MGHTEKRRIFQPDCFYANDNRYDAKRYADIIQKGIAHRQKIERKIWRRQKLFKIKGTNKTNKIDQRMKQYAISEPSIQTINECKNKAKQTPIENLIEIAMEGAKYET